MQEPSHKKPSSIVLCYFCQSGSKKRTPYHYYCDRCANQYQLCHVVTTVGKKHSDGSRQGEYAHIYIEDDSGYTYQIRLHLEENYTWIGYKPTGEDAVPETIMTFPGFPINPSNAKDKLKIYLTFS